MVYQAVGNLLLAIPRTSDAIADASGKVWISSNIVGACVLATKLREVPLRMTDFYSYQSLANHEYVDTA
jgi:hypothetical protein